MEPINNQLESWLEGIQKQQPASWSQLSDIGLYMDQVVTYIDRQLSLYRSSDKEHVLTPAMVNNYVKDALVPRADMKKYAPTHLALLTMIGALKQVLSMQDLHILLGQNKDDQLVSDLYSRFLAGQVRAVEEAAAQVSGQVTLMMDQSGDANAEDELRVLALDLAIEARVRILIAEQILSSIAARQQAEREKAVADEMVVKAVKAKGKKAKPEKG